MAIDDVEHRRIEAEIRKLDAETNALSRSRVTRALELTKVIGTFLVTVVAGYAAITAFRIDQLEGRLARAERAEAEKELKAALQARDKAQSELAKSRAELARMAHDVQVAQQSLATLRVSSEDARKMLSSVNAELQQATKKFEPSEQWVLIAHVPASNEALAKRLGERLKSAGYQIEVVRGDPSYWEDRSYIRYFQAERLADASRLLAVVRAAGIPHCTLERDRARERAWDDNIIVVVGSDAKATLR